eukprot:CAMPEP_0115422668 /NCGR_PEP_ID=MMETSP0271-20121206/26900_1 /TAXON_ID=71861 /ORGANISM="Scrippsiella trochoidea, Strain CCMP3099" /LENGTH=60 /DNA_ID=CAMNT_0002847377 /DNA_START=120 /DNA_END=299 /DNA_ORIENTATION=-
MTLFDIPTLHAQQRLLVAHLRGNGLRSADLLGEGCEHLAVCTRATEATDLRLMRFGFGSA